MREISHLGSLVRENKPFLLEAWYHSFGIEFNATAMDVSIDEFSPRVVLADGREIAVPLEYFPRLREATPEQLGRWELLGGGDGIHWEELDEDISVHSLLRLH